MPVIGYSLTRTERRDVPSVREFAFAPGNRSCHYQSMHGTVREHLNEDT